MESGAILTTDTNRTQYGDFTSSFRLPVAAPVCPSRFLQHLTMPVFDVTLFLHSALSRTLELIPWWSHGDSNSSFYLRRVALYPTELWNQQEKRRICGRRWLRVWPTYVARSICRLTMRAFPYHRSLGTEHYFA